MSWFGLCRLEGAVTFVTKESPSLVKPWKAQPPPSTNNNAHFHNKFRLNWIGRFFSTFSKDTWQSWRFIFCIEGGNTNVWFSLCVIAIDGWHAFVSFCSWASPFSLRQSPTWLSFQFGNHIEKCNKIRKKLQNSAGWSLYPFEWT